MKGDMHTYGRLIREALPYWKIAVVAMLSMALTAAMEPMLPALMAPLIDESLIDKDPSALIQIPLLIVAVFVLKGSPNMWRQSRVSTLPIVPLLISDPRSSPYNSIFR